MRMTMAMEEGQFPSTADNIPEQLVKIWKGLFGLDGKLERILDKFKTHMEIKPDRGPDDFEVQAERIERLVNAAEALRRRPHRFTNGDSEADVRKWIAGVGVVLSAAYVIGGWAISNQVSAQSVKLDDIREHQREQDERISRLEQFRYDERSRNSGTP